jgi:hypothetical protein
MDMTNGYTITVAFKPATPANGKFLWQRSSGNSGISLLSNLTAKPIILSTGNGTTRTSSTAFTWVDATVQIACIAFEAETGNIYVNKNGVEVPANPSKTAPFVEAASTPTLICYQYKGDLYYFCIHTRVLTSQERAQMMKYAQKICRQRGLIA